MSIVYTQLYTYMKSYSLTDVGHKKLIIFVIHLMPLPLESPNSEPIPGATARKIRSPRKPK